MMSVESPMLVVVSASFPSAISMWGILPFGAVLGLPTAVL